MSTPEEFLRKSLGKRPRPNLTLGGGRWMSRTQDDPYESENTRALRLAKEGGYDLTIGAGAGLRARLAWQPDPKVKEEILTKTLGSGNWKRNESGALLVKVKDPKDASKDIWTLVDERGLSWGDLADFAGSAPEIVGGILAYAAGTALGITPAGWGVA